MTMFYRTFLRGKQNALQIPLIFTNPSQGLLGEADQFGIPFVTVNISI